MPEQVERKWREEAQRKFPNDEKRQNAYIFGTLRKTGWKPRKEQ